MGKVVTVTMIDTETAVKSHVQEMIDVDVDSITEEIMNMELISKEHFEDVKKYIKEVLIKDINEQ